jgi:hypothetical protein
VSVVTIPSPDVHARDDEPFEACTACPACEATDYHRFWAVKGSRVQRICGTCGYGWWQT